MDSLSILPYMNRYVFSVESNSRISALAFNSASYESVFIATGEPVTRGYAKVTIARSLVQNVQNVRVYLEGNSLNYTLASTEDFWILNLDYSHSTHKLSVDLVEAVPESMTQWLLIIGLVTATLLVSTKLRHGKKNMVPIHI